MIALAMMAEFVRGLNYQTGESVYTACISTTAEDQAKCTGYLSGIADLEALGEAAKVLPPTVCMPVGVPIATVKDIVVQYYRANPGDRPLGAAGSIVIALSRAYPCPKNTA